MGDDLVLRWCADCRTQQLFEVPPCGDGHDASAGGCPDLACTACGAAAVRGIAETAVVGAATAARTSAA